MMDTKTNGVEHSPEEKSHLYMGTFVNVDIAEH